jgi:hypothetical protein
MDKISQHKIMTINPGGTTIKEKDVRSRGGMLGYQSLKKNETKNFAGELDLKSAVLPTKIAILVDDIATLTVKEIERNDDIVGTVFEDTFRVDGTALWNGRSYKEFSTTLPTGRKYKLSLEYKNNAHLTPKYNGEIDVDGVSIYVSLLPVEIRVRQDKGKKGPHGSPVMYETPRPQNGDIRGELFSLWPNEEAYVTIVEPLGNIIDAGDFPDDMVEWSSPDLATVMNKKEYKVIWTKTGLKVVKLMIAGKEFKIRINVPDVGKWDRTSDKIRELVGDANLAAVWVFGTNSMEKVELKYGVGAGAGGTKQDAVRHSTWNAATAQLLGLAKTILATTANEYHGKHSASAFSSNATMDLHNNLFGASVGSQTPVAVTLDQWIIEMENIFDQGSLHAWTPPANNVSSHFHMLRYSTQAKIFND